MQRPRIADRLLWEKCQTRFICLQKLWKGSFGESEPAKKWPAAKLVKASPPVFFASAAARKPNSVSKPFENGLEAIISLGHSLPNASSDLPAEVVRLSPHAPWAKATPAYLVLLTVGFTLPLELPPARCALTAPFHPCSDGFPSGRYLFCGTFRRIAPPRR